MSSQDFFFYTEANLFCVVLFGVILFHDARRFNRQETQIRFDAAILFHILYFISDSFWAALESGVIPATPLLLAVVNFSNFFLMSTLACVWFQFLAASESLPLRNTRKGRVFTALPMLVMSGLMAFWYALAPRFWISETGSLNPLYFPLMVVAPFFYITACIAFTIPELRKHEKRSQRRHYVLIAIYPLLLAVFGILQIITLTAPVFCTGCTVMMLYFYIQTLEDEISIDPLTKLNNRGELMRYISEPSSGHMDELRTFVMMVDVNDFKTINDSYGHAEGDRALVLVADSLRGAAGAQRGAFLGRYGGDEFILIVHIKEEEELEALCQDIRQRLSQACQEQQTPYQVAVGIGYDELLGAADSFQECTKRADAKLYKDKRVQKLLRLG